MSNLDHKNMQLALEGQTLIARLGNERQRSIPLYLLERVVISASVDLQSRVLTALAERGIVVAFISTRKVRIQAVLLGSAHNQAGLRLGQYQCVLDTDWRHDFSCVLIDAKLKGQARLLRSAALQRFDCRKHLLNTARSVESIREQIPGSKGLDQLRGYEGAAARLFFGAYQQLFAPILGFEGRKRRPPPDPVNVMLSLSYTLLHVRAVQLAHAAGLDPMLGFLHEPVHGRESLACDLVEPWRPCIERWVWEQFKCHEFREERFQIQADGSCLLDKTGRAQFYPAFERMVKPLHRAIRLQTYKIRCLIAESVD